MHGQAPRWRTCGSRGQILKFPDNLLPTFHGINSRGEACLEVAGIRWAANGASSALKHYLWQMLLIVCFIPKNTKIVPLILEFSAFQPQIFIFNCALSPPHLIDSPIIFKCCPSNFPDIRFPHISRGTSAQQPQLTNIRQEAELAATPIKFMKCLWEEIKRTATGVVRAHADESE